MLRTTTVILATAAWALACGVMAAPNRDHEPIPGQAPQIGSEPATRHPLLKKPKAKVTHPVDTSLRTDYVVLGSNVGAGFNDPPPKVRVPHTIPIIHAPPDWRGTQDEWEMHVRECDAQFGGEDWFSGAYIAGADLLARCPYNRGADGAIATARERRAQDAKR